MELIEIIFTYHGGLSEVQIYPENNFKEALYPIDINGKYTFTLRHNDKDEWMVMRESSGRMPQVEDELLWMILKQLKWELKHAALS